MGGKYGQGEPKMKQKELAYRNQKYLTWVKNRNCLVTGKEAEVAHHVRFKDSTSGMGLRPSDYRVLPLLNSYHTTGGSAIHRIGALTFYRTFRINPDQAILMQMVDYLKETFQEKVVLDESIPWKDYIPLLERKIESLRPRGEIEAEEKREVAKKKRVKKLAKAKKKFLDENEEIQGMVLDKKRVEKKLREKAKENQKIYVDGLQANKQFRQREKEMRDERNKMARELSKAYREKVKLEMNSKTEEEKEKERQIREDLRSRLKKFVSVKNSNDEFLDKQNEYKEKMKEKAREFRKAQYQKMKALKAERSL
jgi:hypothetical protein